jgi:formylglycine-generating enzyme required for sulfatase activity
MPRLCSSLLLLLLIASSASAVTMAWTPIGNPGNAGDTSPGSYAPCGTYGNQPCGAVLYAYQIGTYDVTNAQYAEFLNAKAKSDPLGLWIANMGEPGGSTGSYGGITRSGVSGSYAYSAIAGHENMPVNFVSWYGALRFANWMNNGQGNGDTETGSYTLNGTNSSEGAGSVPRNAGATIVLPTQDEWYKAAFYNPSSSSYFAYPASSNTPPTCSAPTAAPNHANCDDAVGDFTQVGSYTGSASPYGTFDQGGNIAQWIESLYLDYYAQARGATFGALPLSLAANQGPSYGGYPTDRSSGIGFRLAMIPEPSTGLLVFAGLLGLAGWRRSRA